MEWWTFPRLVGTAPKRKEMLLKNSIRLPTLESNLLKPFKLSWLIWIYNSLSEVKYLLMSFQRDGTNLSVFNTLRKSMMRSISSETNATREAMITKFMRIREPSVTRLPIHKIPSKFSTNSFYLEIRFIIDYIIWHLKT